MSGDHTDFASQRQRLMLALEQRRGPEVCCDLCQSPIQFHCDELGRVSSSDCACHRYRHQFRPI